MFKPTIIEVKPKTIETENEFINLRRQQSSFGKIIRINLSQDNNESQPNKIFQFLFQFMAQIALLWYCFFLYFQLITEHQVGNGDLSIDLFTICATAMILVLSLHSLTLFHKQKRVRSLLNRCESFYITSSEQNFGVYTSDDHEIESNFEQINGSIKKLINILHILSYQNPVFLLSMALILSLVMRDLVFVFPTYNPTKWKENLRWAILINAGYVLFSFYFNRILLYALSLFTILVHHIAGEYKCMTITLQKLSTQNSGNLRKIYKGLTKITDRHSNLLQMLNDIDNVFNIPLLASEMFCIVSIPLVGFTFLYARDALSIGVGTISLLAFKISYCFLGQRVTTSAVKFESAVYECEWLEFDPDARKQFRLILQLAQKSVGVTSGGFHYINHSQMTQVDQCFYYESAQDL